VQDYLGELVTEGKTNLNFTEAGGNEWQWREKSAVALAPDI